jgi:hypothetical protein
MLKQGKREDTNIIFIYIYIMSQNAKDDAYKVPNLLYFRSTRAIGGWCLCLCLSIWHIMKGSSSYSTYEREESIKTKALKWSRGWKIKLELDNTLGRNPTLQKQKNAKAAPKQTHTLVSALKMLLPSPFYSSLLSHSPPH